MNFNITVMATFSHRTIEYSSEVLVAIGSEEDMRTEIMDVMSDELDGDYSDVDVDDIDVVVTDWDGIPSVFQDFESLEELADYNGHYDIDVLEAAYNCDIQFADVDETYSGEFRDDEEFTEQLLTDCGDIPDTLPVYLYIDWERTARDVMMDYTEDSGHYYCM